MVKGGFKSPMEWVQVGKIKDAFHLRGELYVLVFSGEWAWLDKLEQCQVGGQTYQVKKAREHKDGLVLSLKEVTDRTQAEFLKGKMFCIPQELLISEDGETIYLSEIEGFTVVDSNSNNKGTIESFSSNGDQDLLVLKVEGKKKLVEIPFVEDFIDEIEFENKVVRMNLPEGIWDIE